MSTRTEIPAEEPVIVMTRTFDAPRALVWEADVDVHAQPGRGRSEADAVHDGGPLLEHGREAAIAMGFTKAVEASHERLVTHLPTMERR